MTLSHSNSPLADRMRPHTLDEFVGQTSLLGPGRILRRAIESDRLSSMILWGPPGTGKTTLARIIAGRVQYAFHDISAVTSGVAQVRSIIAAAEALRQQGGRTLLFIDEIHRFNKAQQDALLHSVEDGTLLLIGATSENPGIEVIGPLLSRCRVFRMEPLSEEELTQIIDRALAGDAALSAQAVQLDEEARRALIRLSAGDARTALNALELAAQLAAGSGGKPVVVDRRSIEEALQRRAQSYDKRGDYHYDTISAFIKSVRGSDPDAAVYWLARMLEAGEDPLFIARRLIILASEDIGNADPHALMVATSAAAAVHQIGMPEARIVLAQTTTYLASAPKSNASYLAIEAAAAALQQGSPADVPLHLRNAPTRLMKQFGHAAGYQYPHDSGGFVDQAYRPAEINDAVLYRPTENGIEARIRERLVKLWPRRKR